MKEVKPREVSSHDPNLVSDEYAPNNTLTVPQVIKDYLIKNELDWRFLNASQFRAAGNFHGSQWRAFKIPPELAGAGLTSSAEGIIQRGDLILGIRSKGLSAKYKEQLAQRNKAYSNFNQTEAKKMREHVRKAGIEGVSIEEGYEDEGKSARRGSYKGSQDE